MEISARNQLKGTVKSVNADKVMAEVVIEVAPGVEIVSVITTASAQRIGAEVGRQVTVIIKATEVMLGTDQ